MANISLASQAIISKDENEEVRLLQPQKAALALCFAVLLMILFGLTMLYSTSSGLEGATLFIKQMIWVLVGIPAALITYFIGYRRVIKLALIFIGISAILLIIARMSKPINGAHRWIHLPLGMSIQPSEFAKLAVIIFLAQFCSTKQRFINSFYHGLLPIAGITSAIAALILSGKDLGTAVLLAATVWLLLFVAGVKLKYLLLSLALVPFGSIYLRYMDPERWSRITSFLDPESCMKESGYQLWNSLLALGSGSWTGLGFTQSRMKAMYLPEAHTDFILSIVGEELGFIAMVSITLAYFLVMILTIYISIRSKDRQGMLLGVGISSLISLQSIINIGVISGALPTKGIPSPFISYGGSNMLMCLCAVGLLISIANPNQSETPNKSNLSFLKNKAEQKE